MDERPAAQGQPPRRRLLRALPTPTDVEIYVQDAPPLLDVIDDLPEPRVAELDALLREVDGLRSTLRRDLTLAATAVEAGDNELAGWLLLGDGGEVRSFEDRALAHLSAMDNAPVDEPAANVAPVPAPRRAARMMPAAPLVAAAAAIVGFLTGVVPGTGGSPMTSPRTANAALDSYAHLTQLASHGASPSRLTAAAEKFHADLAPLVAAAGTNPAAAEKAIALLQSERAVIAGEADSPALQAVLAQADLLVQRLRATLPRHVVRPVVPVVPPQQAQQRHQSPGNRSTASTKPSASPSPKASPKPSPSPSASSAPKPSPSPSSSGNPIPHTPGALPH
ncbi:MAG: hypothetical protein QOE84_1526 [Actinomycetota bacterium]|nr:hypothetical protein [Actinomycetota bacterium]